MRGRGPRRQGGVSRPPSPRGTGYTAPTLAILSALIGASSLVVGVISGYLSPTLLYSTVLAGYDPPFDAISGLLLMALAIGIRDRSRVAWLFSPVAPALIIAIAFLSPNILSVSSAFAATVLVILLYRSRARFYRGPLPGAETAEYGVFLAALLSVLYGVVGARFLGNEYTPHPGIQGWTDSLYFTIATISTNGSNFTPVTPNARIFGVILIVVGTSSFLSAIVVFFVPLIQRRLQQVASRLEVALMDQLVDHVIVCGASVEVRSVAQAVREARVPLVILAPESPELDHLTTAGYRTHVGDPSNEETLREVGVERARALIAADKSDAENLLTVITARGLSSQIRIVAVAAIAESTTKFERAGATTVISLPQVAARLVTDAALAVGSASGRP
ncbi:MAG: NAD-binding protein [Thermoplasmata archaeon]